MSVNSRRARPPLNTRYAVDAGRDVPLGHDSRPTWRGRVHLVGLVVATPAMAALVLVAEGPRATAGCAVYAWCMATMFGVSVAYHRWVHDLRARAVWRRLDHAAIFLAIAGSATPLALVAMSPRNGAWAVAAIWLTAIPGIVLKLGRWHHGDVAGSVLYFVVGFECLVVLPGVVHTAGVVPLVLAVAAALIYAVGALCFGLKIPRMLPGVFGYHEVWHTATVVAATTHFVAVWLTVT
ncbi:MAG: hemolysin III family protein [Ilumatobacteraceae bacterium]